MTITWTIAPPTASIAAPAAGATLVVGQTVASSFTCADAMGGPGIATCSIRMAVLRVR